MVRFSPKTGEKEIVPRSDQEAPMENYRPYKARAEVLKIFGETKSDWCAAFWLAGLNSFLDDQRPQDLLATRPDLVIAAARDEADGVQHG